MIIIKIIGGLGNQLFQYAAARCLAELRETVVKLDITDFKDYHLRSFELARFSFDPSIASIEEIKPYKADTTFKRIRSYLTPITKRTFYKEPYYHFDPRFFHLGNAIYLQGFFQSEKYFKTIETILRNELQLKKSLTENVSELGRTLRSKCSVSLHIRRGDYNNTETSRYHGVIPLSYYQEAINIVKSRVDNPHFYIFSDDSKWVTENLKIENATIVSGVLSDTHFEDLYLMSQCQHNIIANSSFSWWGAWLNNNTSKIVIAPKPWFNEGPKDTQDLYAEGWIQL